MPIDWSSYETAEQPETDINKKKKLNWDAYAPAEPKKGGINWDSYQVAEKPTGSAEPDNSGLIGDSELEGIAANRGVDVNELKQATPFFGGRRAAAEGSLTEDVKEVAGVAGQTIGMGLPQFLYKKFQDDPNMRDALDDLRELADSKKSTTRKVLEFGTSVASGLATGRAVASGITALAGSAKVAETAKKLYDAASLLGGGATLGVTDSREGEEVKGAAIGAATGAALGTVLWGGSKLIKRALKKDVPAIAKQAEKTTEEGTAAALKEVEANGLNLDREADAVIERKGTDIEDIKAFLNKDGLEAADTARIQRKSQAPAELSKEAEALAGKRSVEVPVREELKEFAEYLGTTEKNWENSKAFLQKRLATEGEEQVAKEFDAFQRVKAVQEVIKEKGVSFIPEEKNFMTLASDFIRDGKFVAREIDDRLGTKVEVVQDKLSAASNLLTLKTAQVNERIQSLAKETQGLKLGVDEIYEALDKGAPLADSTAEATIQGWRQFFEQVRQEAVEMGIPIMKRENYVPHKLVEPATFIVKIDQRLRELDNELGKSIREGTAELKEVLSSDKGKELVSALNMFVGDTITSTQELTRAARLAGDARMYGTKEYTKAAAAFMREGDIPNFVREKDVVKLARSWSSSTFRHAFFREGLTELRAARDVALAAKDKSAQWLTNSLYDLTAGMRPNTADTFFKRQGVKFKGTMLRAAEEARNPIHKAGLEFLANSSELMSTVFNQIYPNFLGYNLRSALVNLTQPLLTTIPELGQKYGAEVFTRGLLATANTLKSGKEIVLKPAYARAIGRQPGEVITTRNLGVILENMGLANKQWTPGLVKDLRQGIENSYVGKATGKALELNTKAAMFLFELSETSNRALVMHMAENVGSDLLKGKEGAKKFMKEMGSGYRRQAEELLKAGDETGLKELMSTYLQAKTMFNYNRVTMSEFGRTMGPFFSVFSKWPTAIAGDMLESFRRKGALGGASQVGLKYLAPLMALYAGDKFLHSEDNPTLQTVVGKSGLKSFSPVGSVTSIVSGQLLQPPAVALVTGGVGAVAKLDAEAGWKWANNTAASFVPGAGLIRFMAKDVSTWLEGKPRQGAFLEQAESVLTSPPGLR